MFEIKIKLFDAISKTIYIYVLSDSLYYTYGTVQGFGWKRDMLHKNLFDLFETAPNLQRGFFLLFLLYENRKMKGFQTRAGACFRTDAGSLKDFSKITLGLIWFRPS